MVSFSFGQICAHGIVFIVSGVSIFFTYFDNNQHYNAPHCKRLYPVEVFIVYNVFVIAVLKILGKDTASRKSKLSNWLCHSLH